MAVANGFGKVVTSGSVFMYDTGDTVNSYIGEPTTNMWGIESGTNVNNRSTWSMPYAYNGSITDSVYSSGTWNGNRIWEVLHTAGTSGYAGFESWRLCVNQPTAGNTIYNTTRRVAIKICILEGSITDLALHSGGGNSSHNGSNWTPIPESQVPRDCPQKTGWYQFLADGSWASNSVGHCVGLAFISYNRVRILTTEPMYYPSNKLLPFTGYQRSATQGLLPLIGNSTINLSNVSFDSNAQIVFDGTDDYIITSNIPAMSNWTIETIINLSNYTTSQKVILDVNLGIRFEINNGYFNSHFGDGSGWVYTNLPSTFTYTANTTYHVVVTVQSGGQAKMYINGILNNSTNIGSGTTPSVPLYIGRFTGTTGYEIAGTLPIVKIYNRAISESEVKQNYNKYKTRFNLP